MIDLTDPNIRTEVVKALYLEKKKKTHPGLMDFSFTPGPGWMDIPVVDFVNQLFEFFSDPDSVVESKAPETGLKKRELLPKKKEGA